MRSALLAVIVGLFLIAAASAQAAPAITGTFDLPEKPTQNPPALGPDGNVWVTLQNAGNDYASVTPAGVVTPYDSPDISGASGITVGPDGNMWITGTGYVGRFSTANPTSVTKTDTIVIGSSNHIVVGPDGNLWTGSDGKVVKITPTNTPTITGFPTGVSGFVAKGIASAGGKLWVANGDNSATGGIVPISTDGTPGTLIPAGKQVQQIAAGLNGQLAYTSPIGPETIGLIDNGVARPQTPVENVDPFGIIFGQDEAYWTPQFGGDTLARYTADGAYTVPISFPTGSGPRFATQGAGDTIWVGLETTQKIVRISGIEKPDTAPPVISALKLTNTKFKVGTKKTALVAKAKKMPAKTGTTIKYTLSENATTSIAVLKGAAGRTSGAFCVKPTAKLKKAKKCTRYVLVKTLTRLQLAGANSVAFSGRIESKKLKPGKYRFAITAKDAKGNMSPASTKSFTIVKK
jgi:streptogramin lyase